MMGCLSRGPGCHLKFKKRAMDHSIKQSGAPNWL